MTGFATYIPRIDSWRNWEMRGPASSNLYASTGAGASATYVPAVTGTPAHAALTVSTSVGDIAAMSTLEAPDFSGWISSPVTTNFLKENLIEYTVSIGRDATGGFFNTARHQYIACLGDPTAPPAIGLRSDPVSSGNWIAFCNDGTTENTVDTGVDVNSTITVNTVLRIRLFGDQLSYEIRTHSLGYPVLESHGTVQYPGASYIPNDRLANTRVLVHSAGAATSITYNVIRSTLAVRSPA